MTYTNILCKGEILAIIFTVVCIAAAYEFLFLHFRNAKPDGHLMQPKHVAFWITIIKCCVWTVCFIVTYCIHTAGMIHIENYWSLHVHHSSPS